MKPRQLVIVHGPPEASLDLAESCKVFSGKDIKVYTPKLQETVDATSETHIYQVRSPRRVCRSSQRYWGDGAQRDGKCVWSLKLGGGPVHR